MANLTGDLGHNHGMPSMVTSRSRSARTWRHARYGHLLDRVFELISTRRNATPSTSAPYHGAPQVNKYYALISHQAAARTNTRSSAASGADQLATRRGRSAPGTSHLLRATMEAIDVAREVSVRRI
jgi:hypothetical protein